MMPPMSSAIYAVLMLSCTAVLIREQTFLGSTCDGTADADTTSTAGVNNTFGPCIMPTRFSNSWQLAVSGTNCSTGTELRERIYDSTDCSGSPTSESTFQVGDCTRRTGGTSGSIEYTCSAYQQATTTWVLVSLFCISTLWLPLVNE
eukprot:m.9872 g.9872  ORF g.9872 m.9872 type:complete len:147 (+) comp9514_c0_seq1:201-641(+)